MSESQWSTANSLTTKASYIPNSEEAMLSASDKAAEDYFGSVIAIDDTGIRVIVGSYGADPSGINYGGKAYIFTRTGSTWSQEAILTANTVVAAEYFGFAVAITGAGDRVIIGARGATATAPYSGAVYVFIRSGTTWTQESRFGGANGSANDQFGYSVAVDSNGDRIAIGAPSANPGSIQDAGAVYIFRRNVSTWIQEAYLSPSEINSGIAFGQSTIDITSDGTRMIAGAPYLTAGGISGNGRAYVFVRSGTTWSQEQIIANSDAPATYDNYGSNVAISGDGTRLVIGCLGKEYGGYTDAGACYVYSRSGSSWSFERKILSSTINSYSNFGGAIAINNNGSRIAIGETTIQPGTKKGAVHTYVRSGTAWSFETKITASQAFTGIGGSIDIASDGFRIASGNSSSEVAGVVNAGAAYIFS